MAIKYLLADFGSTNIKYCCYDSVQKSCFYEGRIPFPPPSLDKDGRFEVEPAKIKDIAIKIADAGADAGCRRMLISVQMHGFLLCDDNGPITPYISWRDKRGDISPKALWDIDFCARGTALKSNLPLVKLFSNDPAANGIFMTLGSYICHCLCGNNTTHITDAAASGLFLADSGKPAGGLFKDLILPGVVTSVVPAGSYRGMDVYVPMGDHQISYLGSGAGEEACLLNIGTAAQLCTLSDARDAAGCEARPYFNKKRLLTVSGLIGGSELAAGCSEQTVYESYKKAFDFLPARRRTIAAGGGALHHRELLLKIFKRLGRQLEFINNPADFGGLIKMAEKLERKTGTMLSEIAFDNFPVIVKNTGLDFFIIDFEHGGFDYSAVARLVMNANLIGTDVIIRLPDNRRMNITKFADMGAAGFILPMTNRPEDIEKVVEYGLYAPVGRRGISTTRAHTMYNPPALLEYMKSANERLKIYAQIETKAGVDNIEQILAVEGVAGVFIGPNDLSCDLGCIGDKQPVQAAIERVCGAASAAGRECGIITTDRDYIRRAAAFGASMLSYGSELNMLINSCKSIKRDGWSD